MNVYDHADDVTLGRDIAAEDGDDTVTPGAAILFYWGGWQHTTRGTVQQVYADKAPPLYLVVCENGHQFHVRVVACRDCGGKFFVARDYGQAQRPWPCMACRAKRRREVAAIHRAAKRPPPLATCACCGASVIAQRSTRRYCSTACRVAALRQRRAA